MRATYIMACVIGALVLLWLASGQFRDDPPPPAESIAEQNRRVDAAQQDRQLTPVRVATIASVERDQTITIRGRTQSKRTVLVQSQISGIVTERPVDRGDSVSTGDLLCRISTEERDAALLEAEAQVTQARHEYEGSQKLSKKGLQSETAIAQARARLATAETELHLSKLNLERLNISAPFDGIVEAVHMEVGQFVMPGANCITLVDLDPMLLTGNTSETNRALLKTGQVATATLGTGESITGQVSFVGKTADKITRTYTIEVEFDNNDGAIASGLSANIVVPVARVQAHKISPALLILDDEGQLGVHTINGDNVVSFVPISILNDEADGIWVTDIPSIARIITVGQQLVVAGEEVIPTEEPIRLVNNQTSEDPTL